MHTLTAEEVKVIKAVAKADRFGEMTFRRHNLGTDDDVSTALLTWSERNKITQELEQKKMELPWTTFGITDYGDRVKRHAYGRLYNAFACIAGLIREDDLMQVHITLSEHDYAYCEVWIERKGKTVYRGYTDCGRPGNFYSDY